MSAIAGLFHLDGRPADRRTLERMAGGLQHPALESAVVWTDGAVGLIHARLATTPEESREAQPFAAPSSGLTIALNGRLDNRSDLQRSLDARDPAPPAVGDAELLLRAYRVFGDAGVDHLLGDFAFAIWDGPRQRLFCARDQMGTRPFYYRQGPSTIAFATDVAVLARHAGPTPPPNEGFAGEHLAGVVTNVHDTLFQGIYRLPAAHVLIADAQGVRRRRYWTPDPRAELRYRRDEDYVEHLSALVRDAVAVRLRADGPVGVMLSGGVDSSSVAGIANELCGRRAVPATGIESFSLAIEGADESEFFNQVIDHLGVPAHRVPSAAPTAGHFQRDSMRSLDVPMAPNTAIGEPLRALVATRGIRVLLTGLGADEWLGTSDWAYADLVRRGRMLALASRIRLEAMRDGFRGWPTAAKMAVWPLVPASAKRAIKRALGRGRPPAWIEPGFAARIDLRQRLAQHEVDIPFPSHEQYDIWHEGTSGASVAGAEALDRVGAHWGIEHRHPYWDRRLVEFGLALPPDQRWRQGRSKDLLRRTVASYVPPAVMRRLANANASHVLVDAIELEGGASAIEGMTVAKLEWVSASRVRGLYESMWALRRAGDDRYAALAWTLWHILSIEIWLQAALGEDLWFNRSPEQEDRTWLSHQAGGKGSSLPQKSLTRARS